MDGTPPDEKKPAESTPASQPAPETKTAETKPVEVKTPEQAAAEEKAAAERLAARQAEERKAAAQKALDKQFLESARKGNLTELRELLGKGANLLAADDGNTALFYAAQYGRKDTVLFLLDKGIPLNVKNRIGSTPLTGAAAGGHKEVAQLLYDLGANPRVPNLTGMSALNYARSAGYTDMIELLSKPRNLDEVVLTRQTGDRTLQEIFNFAQKERLSLVRKGEDGPVEAMQRDSFAELADTSGLRRAFDLYKQRGGKAAENEIFPAPPAILPEPEQKSLLPWKRRKPG